MLSLAAAPAEVTVDAVNQEIKKVIVIGLTLLLKHEIQKRSRGILRDILR